MVKNFVQLVQIILGRFHDLPCEKRSASWIFVNDVLWESVKSVVTLGFFPDGDSLSRRSFLGWITVWVTRDGKSLPQIPIFCPQTSDQTKKLRCATVPVVIIVGFSSADFVRIDVHAEECTWFPRL